jgi:hypothetical protein
MTTRPLLCAVAALSASHARPIRIPLAATACADAPPYRTPPQFVIGFTKIVLIAGYTSLTVSSLLSQQASTVTTFREAIDARYRFCANVNSVNSLVSLHPELTSLMVSSSPTPSLG